MDGTFANTTATTTTTTTTTTATSTTTSAMITTTTIPPAWELVGLRRGLSTSYKTLYQSIKPYTIFRTKSRKEKNKLASRACRLKKKAQHEANKLKLHGLEEEHSE